MGEKNGFDNRLLLNETALFAGLPDADLDDLVAIAHRKRYAEQDTVFVQGEAGDALYLVAEGSVRLEVELDGGQRVALGEVAQGAAFGEVALFDGRPRTADAIAATPTECLVLERGPVRDFLLEHPRVALRLLEVLAGRLRETDDLMRDTLDSDIAARLAKHLLGLASVYGQRTRAGTRIDADFSDAEIAHATGLSEQTVQAQLRNWERNEVVQRRGASIVIRDPVALEAIV
jgi:CRP/FNR family cyclic AMP-dependent transcriptional regulator